MKVVFFGFIDSTNIGDLLIAESLNQHLMQNYEVKAFSFDFLPATKTTNDEKSNGSSKIVNSSIRESMIFKRIRNLKISDSLINKLINRLKRRNFDKANVDEYISEADFVILGGGNTVFDLSPNSDSSFKIQLIMDSAKRHDKRVFVTSIGIGPFQTQKQLDKTVKVLSAAEYITTRDARTFSYLEKLNEGRKENKVFSSIDPVFVYETPVNTKRVRTSIQHVGVNIMDLNKNKNSEDEIDRYLKSMKELIDYFSKKEYKVSLFSSEPQDYIVFDSIYSNFEENPNVSIKFISEKDQLFNFYEELDFIIGTRMHAIIIGILFNIPVMGVSWQPKVSEMFKLIGLENYYFNLNSFNTELDKFIKTFDNIDLASYNEQLKEIHNFASDRFSINQKCVNRVEDSLRLNEGTEIE